LGKISFENFNISENNIISAKLAKILRYFFFPKKKVGGVDRGGGGKEGVNN
jgi:hypothetical protein